MRAAIRPAISARTPRMVTLRLAAPGVRSRLPEPRDWTLARGGRAMRSGRTDRAVLALDDLEPDAEYALTLDGAAPFEFRTAPCAGLVDVTNFGACTGSEDNSGAFAAAIAATPTGGTLRVPAGRFETAAIFLRAGVTLHLDAGATLAALADRHRIPILPARHADGRMLGSWEGLPAASYAALVNAFDARGVTIAGSGTLDGGGDRGDWWTWAKETREGARRARTVFLSGCDDVTLAGITVHNSPSWTIHPLRCRLLTASALTIRNPPDSPNTDGLNPESCEDVLIEGVDFSVGDDCIAIKAGKRAPGITDHLAPTRRVTIRHCLLERGHGGVVIGSEMSGSVTDVTVTACDFRGTDRGLRIKTRRGRGGEVARIALADCTMKGVDTAFVANAYYFCDADGRSAAVQSREPAPVDETTPHIREISIRDTTVSDARLAVGVFLGLPEAPIEAITVAGVRARFDPEARPAVPVMADGVAPMRHAGLCADWAELSVTGEVSPPHLATIRRVSRC